MLAFKRKTPGQASCKSLGRRMEKRSKRGQHPQEEEGSGKAKELVSGRWTDPMEPQGCSTRDRNSGKENIHYLKVATSQTPDLPHRINPKQGTRTCPLLETVSIFNTYVHVCMHGHMCVFIKCCYSHSRPAAAPEAEGLLQTGYYSLH